MSPSETVQKRMEEFDEKFELQNQGCSECGGYELIDKTEVQYPEGSYHCEDDLDKIKSHSLETSLALIESIEEIVNSMIKNELEPVEHSSATNMRFKPDVAGGNLVVRKIVERLQSEKEKIKSLMK